MQGRLATRTRALAACVAVTTSLAATGCRSTPATPPAHGPAGTLFTGAQSKAYLVHDLATTPVDCLPLVAGTEVCEWRIGPGNRRYPKIAAQLGTEDPIAVICVLPPRAAPLHPEACSLHSRRSNRGEFTGASHAQAKATARALAQLQDAGTVIEMTRLLGQLPERCRIERSGVERRCEWTLTRESYGHGTAVQAIGAQRGEKVLWTCRFPIDGGPRAPGSCDGEAL